MRNSSEITVGENRYLVTHYSATVAGELFIELTKKVGPIVGALVAKDKNASVDIHMVAELIQKAVPNFERGDFTRLAKEILKGTLTFLDSGQNVDLNEIYDIHFQGRLTHLYRVLAGVLQFQYSDFLKGPAESTPGPQAGAPTGTAKPIKAR